MTNQFEVVDVDHQDSPILRPPEDATAYAAETSEDSWDDDSVDSDDSEDSWDDDEEDDEDDDVEGADDQERDDDSDEPVLTMVDDAADAGQMADINTNTSDWDTGDWESDDPEDGDTTPATSRPWES